jgi:photosystem II stability/assembly factor-like uncharacterized protein
VFRSSDNGNSWNNIFDLTTANFYDVANVVSQGSYLFVATNYNGVYRSSDNGSSWQAVNNGLQTNMFVNDMTSSGQYLICGGYRPYRSSNYGASWDSCTNGMSTPIYIHAFSTIGTNIYIGTGVGIYLSTNFGTNWGLLNNGLGTLTVERVNTDGINLFAGTSNGIFKSTNNGASWTAINNGIPYLLWVYDVASNGSRLFAASYQGLYRTSNAGVNWETCNTGLISQAVNRFLLSGNKFFCATSGGAGIQYSTNNGDSWEISNNGIYNFYSTSIAVKNNLIFTCGNQQGLAYTSNDGISWQPIQNGFIGRYTYDVAANSSCIFLSSGNLMIKSTDDGLNWIQCNSGISDSSSKLIYAFDDVVFISSSTPSFLYSSTNNGNNWSFIFPSSFQFKTLARIGNYLIAGNDFMEGGGMVRSTNNGLNWSSVQGFLPISIVAKDSVFYLVNPPLNFYKSTNFGLNWVSFSTDFTGYFNKMCMVENKLVILSDSSIYTSSNNGVNWIAKKQGLPGIVRASCLVQKGNNVFLGTEFRGVWKRSKSDLLSIDNISKSIPSDFVLHQNYPNPFNPVTKIKFDIRAGIRSQESEVKLIIYDITGREISILVNEKLNPGTYEVTFDGSNFASGVYFYQLRTGDFVETKKLILLK